MADQQEQEYSITDRRIRYDEPDLPDSPKPEHPPHPHNLHNPVDATPAQAIVIAPNPAGQSPTRPERQAESPQPIETGASEQFLVLLEMLAAPALMYLGETGGQPGAPRQVNLPAVKEFIEILGVLETKTRGNLTLAEQSALNDLLYTLKMRYVEAGKRIAAPR